MAGAACVAFASLALLAPEPPAAPVPPGAGAAAAGSVRQGLIGQWVLNTSESDDPRAKLTEGRPEGGRRGPEGGGPGWGGPGGGSGRGSGGGFGRGRGGFGGRGGPEGEGGARPAAPPLILEAQRITIANLEPEITMLEPDGAVRRLHADGRAYQDSNGAEVTTRWHKDALVVETKAGRGRVKETWSAAAGPRRLTVVVEIERPFRGDAVTIRRVFDAVELDAAPREPAPAGPPGANP
jgi:hypothetical protein